MSNIELLRLQCLLTKSAKPFILFETKEKFLMNHSRLYAAALIVGSLGAITTMIFHPTG